MSDLHPIAGDAPRDPYNKSNLHFARPSAAQRKPMPSPLQVSQSSTPTVDNSQQSSPKGSGSPSTVRAREDSPYSSRSPAHASAVEYDQPKSPRERLDELLATEDSVSSKESIRTVDRGTASGNGLPMAKVQPYPQLRNVSSPLPYSKSTAGSPPYSPFSMASSTTAGSAGHAELRSVPRTSSIDSAISSVSSTTSHSYKSSQDSTATSPVDISHLIATAGSPEALIQHLLKEKRHSAAQNAQLWRLVDKQRTLVLGLNKDLDRALKEKERYRKRLKEQLAQAPTARVPSMISEALPTTERAESASPSPSDSQDDLPIQRHSVREILPGTAGGQVDTVDNADGGNERGVSASGLSTGLQDAGIAKRPIATIHTTELSALSKDGLIESPLPSARSADTVPTPRSFTARRSLTAETKPHAGPTLTLRDSASAISDQEKTPPLARKAPPAPLDLRQPQQTSSHLHQLGPDDHSGSEYDDIIEVDEIPAFERGRKKTREEDDKEREALALKEMENRSRSKKEKGSKPPNEAIPPKAIVNDHGRQVDQPHGPRSPAFVALSPHASPNGLGGHLSPPASLASVLSPPPSVISPPPERNMVSSPPMSPGLPSSPRPIDRPMNSPPSRPARDGTGKPIVSPPLSPRNGMAGMPLSPRPPRHPIPLPPHTPMSLTSPPPLRIDNHDQTVAAAQTLLDSSKEGLVADDTASVQVPESISTESSEPQRARGVFQGLVSESYPELLLPPNALPSIWVKVISSRLKPSRNSIIGMRSAEEEPVFTLGISARSNREELWQVEKPISSLPHLDHQLKQASTFGVKLPDRGLFSGHAPAKIDARRIALESYFEAILDTPMDEKAGLIVCRYLSTQVLQPTADEAHGASSNFLGGSLKTVGLDGRTLKEGYLTKRGKNFGGWKARFFVLDEPVLRYYESQGGHLLGTIKLHNAQIGKQSANHSHSPSRAADDSESQYRHAFLILEPKRKDSSNLVRHVLCAENDIERDQWVEALLQYIDGQPEEEKSRPTATRGDSGSGKLSLLQKRKPSKVDMGGPESPAHEAVDTLQSVSYDQTVSAQAPMMSMPPPQHPSKTPSPPPGSRAQMTAQVAHPYPGKSISGPTNGAIIQDAGLWGNKASSSPNVKDKEQKKRSIWGFRDKQLSDMGMSHSNDSSNSLDKQQQAPRSTLVRPVFGIPLSEAVETCPPSGINVCLPAVVYRCLQYLRAKDVANEEGIFRLSGSSVVIRALRERFNTEGDFDFLADGQYYDVHAVASLLKLYLRELPSTVLTRELHLDFLAVLELESKEKKIMAFNMLVHKLPLPNWTLIRALSEFLIGIVNNSNVNKMSVRNVGIVFAPTLNIPAPVFSTFLTDFEAIFGSEPSQSPATPIEVSVTEPLTPEDIRSPRRQLFSDIPTPSYNQDAFPKHSLTNQQILHEPHSTDQDTGFIPLQPSYETSISGSEFSNTQSLAASLSMPSQDNPVRRTLGPSAMQATKSRRRESSMLMMGFASGDRKSSMPAGMNQSKGMVHEESAFE